MKYQGLREIYQITEYREGCIFKTKRIGRAWVTFGYPAPKDTQFVSISAKDMLTINCQRKVSDDTPDVEMI